MINFSKLAIGWEFDEDYQIIKYSSIWLKIIMLMNINQLAKIHQYDEKMIILVHIHEIDVYSSIWLKFSN